jgi:recombination protein RecT
MSAPNALEVKRTNIKDMLKQVQPALLQILPSTYKDEHLQMRFKRVIQTAILSNPKIMDCSIDSIKACLYAVHQFGLEPNTPEGKCFLIPYKGVATFQLGYHGVMDLAYRSGMIQKIDAEKVYEKDEFEIHYGLTPNLIHRPPKQGDRGKVIGFYAVVWPVKSGMPWFKYITKEEGLAHGKRFSKAFSYESSVWQLNPDAMCLKTVVLMALKYAPRSVEDKWLSIALQWDKTLDEETNPANFGAAEDLNAFGFKAEYEPEVKAAEKVEDPAPPKTKKREEKKEELAKENEVAGFPQIPRSEIAKLREPDLIDLAQAMGQAMGMDNKELQEQFDGEIQFLTRTQLAALVHKLMDIHEH